MFIINITYTAHLDAIDSCLEAHIDFLDQQYKAGSFIASGRKVPRNGGIILIQLAILKEVNRIIDQDPFKINGLADYEIIEFIPSKTAEPLRFLIPE
jgi:uncharacterized protein YciI